MVMPHLHCTFRAVGAAAAWCAGLRRGARGRRVGYCAHRAAQFAPPHVAVSIRWLGYFRHACCLGMFETSATLKKPTPPSSSSSLLFY